MDKEKKDLSFILILLSTLIGMAVLFQWAIINRFYEPEMQGIDNFGVECRVLVTDKPIMGGIFSSLSIFCGISLAVWVSFVVFYCL